MHLEANHKKLASVHISITALILLVYVTTKSPNSSESVFLPVALIIASINLVIGIGCWLKIDFFRQSSLFLSITFLLPTPLVFCLIWLLPWSQWSDSHERSEKALFYTLLFYPVIVAFVILAISIYIGSTY